MIFSQFFKKTEMTEDIKIELRKYLKIERNVGIFSRVVEKMETEMREQVLYELCCDFMEKNTIKSCYKKLLDGKYCYGAPVFDEFELLQKEQDEFVTMPAEVEEGVLECKCGSKKTISFTLQTRSGDEATSVWARCVSCGTKWRA